SLLYGWSDGGGEHGCLAAEVPVGPQDFGAAGGGLAGAVASHVVRHGCSSPSAVVAVSSNTSAWEGRLGGAPPGQAPAGRGGGGRISRAKAGPSPSTWAASLATASARMTAALWLG